MPTEKPNAKSEGKFAEAMRKSKEKRNSMQQQFERRAQTAQKSLEREEASRLDQVTDIKDSEI